MNKIYKVVWNATRGCYVVASELVKTHQGKKSARRGGSILSRAGNAVKLSKILIAHASNSVCFFHALSLPVNNKIKKLVK